ncbi:MAG: protein kinase [Planctomycetes bacterium]|nr:protein kinase [Planctomycetota bacterium]
MSKREANSESMHNLPSDEFASRLAAMHEALVDGSVADEAVLDDRSNDLQLVRAKRALELLERVRRLPEAMDQETTGGQRAEASVGASDRNENVARAKSLHLSGASSSAGNTSHGNSALPDALSLARIDDYEILEEIARGGMGIVFRARHEKLDRVVALKMMLAGPFAQKEERERFRIEAEAAAQLDHPGIVPVYDVAEYQSLPYFTMGFVDGESLWARIQRKPLEPLDAAEITTHMCEALAYAHDRGVVHRDIKPLNVLIDRTGQPRITDFGLARRTDTGSELTGTGQILGTPSYMAPEQAVGDSTSVGSIADVYAVGATLYSMLTGRPPFQAANAIDTLRLVIEQEPVSPQQLNPTIPVDLATICLKCLHKDPQRRYTSAMDLAADLKRFINNEPIQARPVGRVERLAKWSRRRPLVATLSASVAIAVVTLLAGGIWYQMRLAAALDTTELARKEVANILYTSLTGEADYLNQTRPEGYGPRVWQALEQARDLDTPLRDPSRLRQLAVSSLGHLAARDPMILATGGAIVTAANVTADGRFLFAGFSDGQLIIFDLEKHQELLRRKVQDDAIVAIQQLDHDRVQTHGPFCRSFNIWNFAEDTLSQVSQVKLPEPRDFLGLRSTPDGSIMLGVTGLPEAVIENAEWRTTSGPPALTGMVALLKNDDTSEATRFSIRPIDATGSGDPAKALMAPLANIPFSMRFDISNSHLVVAYSWLDREVWEKHGAQSNTISIYDIHTGELETSINPSCGALNSVLFSQDGRLIACAGHIGATIIDRTSGELVVRLDNIGSCGVESFVGSSDVILSNESEYIWYSVRQRQSLARFKKRDDGAYLQVSTPGNHALWLGTDKLRCSNVRGTARRAIVAHRNVAKAVRFSPDGQLIMSSGGDNTIRLWNARTLERLLEIPGSEGDLSPDGSLLAVYDLGCVQFWDVATGSFVGQTDPCEFPNLIRFSPQSDMVVVTGWNRGKFWVWQLDRKRPPTPHGRSPANVSARLLLADEVGSVVATWSPSGRQLAYRSGSRICVHDFDKPNDDFLIDVTTPASYRSVVFLSEERLGIADGHFEVWDLEQRRCDRVSESPVSVPVTLSPNKEFLLCREKIFRIDDMQEVFSLPIWAVEFWSVDWSPDGKSIAFAQNAGDVVVWDLEQVHARLSSIDLDWQSNEFHKLEPLESVRQLITLSRDSSRDAYNDWRPRCDALLARLSTGQAATNDESSEARWLLTHVHPIGVPFSMVAQEPIGRRLQLLSEVGYRLREEGQYQAAEDLLKGVVAIGNEVAPQDTTIVTVLYYANGHLGNLFTFSLKDRLTDGISAFQASHAALRLLEDSTRPFAMVDQQSQFWSHRNFAVALAQNDNRKLAIEHMQKALAIHEDNRTATATIKDMAGNYENLVRWLEEELRADEADAVRERVDAARSSCR